MGLSGSFQAGRAPDHLAYEEGSNTVGDRMALKARASLEERGFIALFALISLSVLVGVVALVLVMGSGHIQRLRRAGGGAQALRAAQEVLSRQLLVDRLRQPRLWLPPLAGESALPDGTVVRWWRRPMEARWRAGSRPWHEAEMSRWTQLGARPEAVTKWAQWLEARLLNRDPALGLKGDLVTDRTFLRGMFADLGLEGSGLAVEQIWTTEEGGSLGRLNLIGADSRALSRLSGIPKERIEAVQATLSGGVENPAQVAGLWSFGEAQAIGPWATLRPFSDARWTVEVRLPTLREPILMAWRSNSDEGPPGNPWFLLRPIPMEQW
jgi:hypothetical protein